MLSSPTVQLAYNPDNKLRSGGSDGSSMAVRYDPDGNRYGPLADEHHALGALLVGDARPAGWRDGGSPPEDVFAAKALVETVLGALRVPWRAEQAQRPFLHPGKAGVIRSGETILGIFGEVHPTVLATWEIDAPATSA